MPDLSRSATDSSAAPLRVLLVDDSASVRAALSRLVASDPGLEVMAAVPDVFAAVERMRREAPDVILLDLELPRMDGLTFLRKLMAQRPLPVVICSSLTERGSRLSMEALEAGAVEVIAKPRLDDPQALEQARVRVCDAVRAAAHARMPGRRAQSPRLSVEPRLTADAVIPPLAPASAARLRAMMPRTQPLICLGASTGGTEALRDVLAALPADAPGAVAVQHMPEGFTAAFARRLDGLCAISVREARDGDRVAAGLALIAPGDRHVALRRAGDQYYVMILDGPQVARHRPSVDVLFRSAAQTAGPNAVGAILTGMGDDGARGLKEMRDMGATTLAQDEESCVVFGMPKEAIARGGAERVLPLSRIAEASLAAARRTGRR